MTAIFVELDEARIPITTYIRYEDGRIHLMVSLSPHSNNIILVRYKVPDLTPLTLGLQKDKLETGPRAFGKRVLNAFLPAGYPISVTPDYMGYQIYVRSATA